MSLTLSIFFLNEIWIFGEFDLKRSIKAFFLHGINRIINRSYCERSQLKDKSEWVSIVERAKEKHIPLNEIPLHEKLLWFDLGIMHTACAVWYVCS